MDNIQEVRVLSFSRVLPDINISFAQIVSVPDPAFLQDLDIAQKRSLIFREYERFRNEAQDEVKNMLGENCLGTLLLGDIHERIHRHH